PKPGDEIRRDDASLGCPHAPQTRDQDREGQKRGRDDGPWSADQEGAGRGGEHGGCMHAAPCVETLPFVRVGSATHDAATPSVNIGTIRCLECAASASALVRAPSTQRSYSRTQRSYSRRWPVLE